MKTVATGCPFCGKPLKNPVTCGRATCQAKAAVHNAANTKRSR